MYLIHRIHFGQNTTNPLWSPPPFGRLVDWLIDWLVDWLINTTTPSPISIKSIDYCRNNKEMRQYMINKPKMSNNACPISYLLPTGHPWWTGEGGNGGWFCQNIMNSLQRYSVGGPCQKDIPSNCDRSINGKACSIRLLPLRVRTTRHVPNPWKSNLKNAINPLQFPPFGRLVD